MTSKVIRAIDVGYGQTKYTHSIDTKGTPIFDAFPSIVEKMDGSVEHFIESGHQAFASIQIDGANYNVGPGITGTSHNVGNLTENFTRTVEYKALLLGALSLMEPVETIDTLVLGLPVQYVKTKQKELKKRFVGKHSLANNRTVNVKSVEVIPQPLGGYLDWINTGDNRKESNLRTLIIDPGFYTFDYVVVRNGTDIPLLNGSFAGGMSLLLEFVAKQISSKYQIDYTNLRAIDDGIMNERFMLYGKDVDLTPMIKPFQKETVSIIQKIVNQMSDGRDIDRIVLVGGGSILFYKAIKTLFKRHELILLDEPMLANVRGFQLYPETLNKGIAA